MRRRGLALGVAVGLGACRTAAPAEGPPASGSRFPDAANIAIMTDGDSLPRPERLTGGPQYPVKLRNGRISGQLAVAFVVDTTGRVEPASISFVLPPAHAEFQESVCTFLIDRARFVPGRTNGRPRRTLVFVPFAFTVSFGAPLGPRPNVKAMQEHARALPRDQLVAELESDPHC